MSRQRTLGRRALLVALGIMALACRPAARRDGKPRRVVSLSPSTTEAVFALGAGERLVGRTRYCDFPPEVARLPSVGGVVDPSFEAIVGLAPDLAVGARGPAGRGIVDRLEASGIRTYFPPTDTMMEIDQMILGLGERLGETAAARALVERMAAERRAVERAVEGRARPRTLLVFGLRPIVAAGPGSFPDQMIRLAGGSNAVATGDRFPTLGIERVLALDPDVVVDATVAATHGPDEHVAAELPGWRELRAARDKRLLPLRDESALRPGPRVGRGIAALARLLHPGASIP